MTESPGFNHAHPRERGMCGTMEVHRRLLNESITYQERRSLIDDRASAYEEAARCVARTGVLTIPVVVHLIDNPANPARNVSDAQIHSQIEVLNQDFRASNPDVSGVPAVWKDSVADCRIEFQLASTDPAGGVTNGITRTTSSVPFFRTHLDDVKSVATGGADAWPSDDYLNLWVCDDIKNKIGQSILGYAQFPGGPPSTDGVVIASWCFGKGGTAEAPFDLGRTATHEIGHWLDLRHIWGDDAGSCSGSDLIADTPNQGGPTFGSPTFPQISCDNGPHGNMFMNYMDYTNDASMYVFTRGQSTRMNACLEGDRASFLTAQVFALNGTAASAGVTAGQATSTQSTQEEAIQTAALGGGPMRELRDALDGLRAENRRLASALDKLHETLSP